MDGYTKDREIDRKTDRQVDACMHTHKYTGIQTNDTERDDMYVDKQMDACIHA